MVKHFKREEIEFIDGIPICPECKRKKRLSSEEMLGMDFEYRRMLDCKNTYGNPNIGQCCCYSHENVPEGLRRD
ncbi:MAG: hypothetical protein ACE5RP_00265 [Nitrosopumilus sp.]